MKNSTVRRIALTASALTSVWAVPALAQDAPSGDGTDIVVTARRFEEKLQDVPISITVFNPEQLAARNIVNSTDLAAYTPSLAANSRFGTEKATFAIRSFTQDLNTAPTVGVYFADVVAPRLASNIPSGGGAGVGLMFDLQNVQVLKGPQGTLFGRNTTGGAILLVPQRPTDKLEGYVEGTYGNYNERRVQAVLNVPLSDTFKLRLGVDRNVRDGYINNRSGIGPDNYNNLNYWSVRASLLANLAPNLENYTVFTWSTTNTTGMLGHMVACNRGTVPGSTGITAPTRALACAQLDRETVAGFGYYDAEGNMPTPFVKQRFWQAINTTKWDVSDNLTVKNIFSFARSKESYAFNITGDNFPSIFVTNTHPGPNDVGQDNRRNITEELQFQGRTSNHKLTWQAGGYLEISDPIGGQFGSQQQYTAVYVRDCSTIAQIQALQCNALIPFSVLPTTPSSISIANNVYKFRTYGIYGQATYNITDKLALTAGIRNTWEYADVSANNVRIVPTVSGVPANIRCSRAVTPTPNPGLALINNPVCTRFFKSESNRPTWLIDLDFKPNADTLIYAKWARGYRGGAVNEANAGAESWNPEKLDLYEIGAKLSFRGAVSGNINVAAFWNELRDQQVTVTIPNCFATGLAGDPCTNPAPTGINGIQNVAKSRIRGIEVEGMVRFGAFRIDYGWTYLDAKITGAGVINCDTTRFNCALATFPATGTLPLFAPKNRATVSVNYDLPVPASVGKITLGMTYVHTDKQISTFGDRAAFLAGALPEDYGLLPGTDLLNLNVTWKEVAGSPIDLAVFCTNLTDLKYRVASAGGLPSTGGEFVLVGEPRMYGVRVKFNFGK